MNEWSCYCGAGQETKWLRKCYIILAAIDKDPEGYEKGIVTTWDEYTLKGIVHVTTLMAEGIFPARYRR